MDDKIKQKQEDLTDMVNAFCLDKLNDEYAVLARDLVEKMGRKREVPFKRGKLEIWASGVIYVLARVNSLFNKSSPNHISGDDICSYFGTKKSTVSQKANYISSIFGQFKLNKEFSVHMNFEEDDMDDFFDEIFYLASTGLEKEALSRLDTIEEDSSEYGRALFYKSIISASLGDNDAADELFKESVISEVSKSSGIDAEVLRDEDFEKVAEELDDLAESSRIFNKGFEFYEEGDFKNALNCFDEALELNPNDSEIIYYKGLALGNLGDFDIALDMIDRAIELKPDEDRYWNDKANFLTRTGNFTEAEKCFDKAIELNPTDSILFANKGFMYLQVEQYEKSLESYKKAYSLNSRDIHNIVCLANVYVELYDFPNADIYFKKASKIDDKNEEYLTAMAHYMMYQEKLDESINYWDKLLDVYPDRAEVWMYKAMVYMMMNNIYEASNCIEKASEINPDIVDLFEEELSNSIDEE